jgi:hypothetical protein
MQVFSNKRLSNPLVAVSVTPFCFVHSNIIIICGEWNDIHHRIETKFFLCLPQIPGEG